MIVLDSSNLFITVSAVTDQIVHDLKTAFNISTTQSAVSSSALSISASAVGRPSWPYLSGVADIDIPIFSAVSSVDYPYKNYDVVSGDEDLSAFPPPNKMFVFYQNIQSATSVSGLSTNECLVYSLTNAYLNTIISALPDVYNKDSETSMTAINPIKRGDLVVRSDNYKTYISKGFTNGLTNWQEISANPSYQYTDWSGNTGGIETVTTDQVYYKEIDGLIHLWFNIAGTPIPSTSLTITLPKALAFLSEICFGGIKVVYNDVTNLIPSITSTGVAVINGSTLTIQKDFSNTISVGITLANGYVCYHS